MLNAEKYREVSRFYNENLRKSENEFWNGFAC